MCYHLIGDDGDLMQFRTQTIQNPVKRIRWSDEMRQTFWLLVKAVDNDSRFEAQQA
jgi:hypothetical protein